MPLGKPNGPTVGFNMPMGKAEEGPLSALAHLIDARHERNRKLKAKHDKAVKERAKARDAWDQKIQEHMGQADPEMDWGTIQETQDRQRQKDQKEARKTNLGMEIGVRPSNEAPKSSIRDAKTGKMQANPAYARHKKREADFQRIMTNQSNIQTIGIHNGPVKIEGPAGEVKPLSSKTSKYYPKPGEGVSAESSAASINAWSSNLSAAQARSQIHNAPPVPEGAPPAPTNTPKPRLADIAVAAKNTSTPS